MNFVLLFFIRRSAMRTLIHTLFFFLFVTKICFAQWFWQNPLPQGNTLNDVCFVDENTGWAAGGKGTFLKTNDGGLNWLPQNIGESLDIQSLNFLNQNIGWLLGVIVEINNPINQIYKTTNGGINWFLQAEFDTSLFTKIQFVNTNTGWAIAGSGWALILKTTNGGDDWNFQTTGQMGDYIFEDCFFVDENIGWIVGENFTTSNERGLILKTTDGGGSWISQASTVDYSIDKVYFVDANHGWAISQNEVLRTTDGGTNWTVNAIISSVWLNSIHFIDEFIGFVVGNDLSGQIYKSTNGGINWDQQSIGNPGVVDVFLTKPTECFVVGNDGVILKTTNGGTDWTNQTISITYNDIQSVHFIDNNTGLIFGNEGLIFKTTNAGLSWNAKTSGTTFCLYKNSFIDGDNGWVVGENGTILKTSNGGETWELQLSGTTMEIRDVAFIDTNNGWIVELNGEILRTTNGGESWMVQVSGATSTLYAIEFTDLNNGWAVGPWNILKTTDGGSTWINYFTGADSWEYTSINFIDQNNGWIAGYNAGCMTCGGIKSTTDGGITWNLQLDGFPIFSILFLNSTKGWAVGYEWPGIITSNSTIYTTVNGGNIWTQQNSGTTNWLWDISFTDANNGWVVGNGGTILHTTNGGVTFIDNEPTQPTEFLLSQNYPNPFNPNTTISWQSPVGSHQAIKVFDVLGNEIATLVDEYKSQGSYEIEFDASTLPSGVYFYRLQAGDFIQTRKMILLK
jgi:photosystem II stability/assembly factor-like uncharacterized protein